MKAHGDTHKLRHSPQDEHKTHLRDRETQIYTQRHRFTHRETDLHANVNRRSRKLLRHQKFSAHIVMTHTHTQSHTHTHRDRDKHT